MHGRIVHLIFFSALICLTQQVRADKYPINRSIDIKHYAFELTLSDSTDEIFGQTSVSVLFKDKDVRKLRLDLAGRTPERNGKGMVVESITLKGQPIHFSHTGDELLLDWSSAAEPGTIWVFVIRYHGMPADGLKIGPTQFGSRSFFVENWPNKTRQWLPTIDHPYIKATSEFIVKAPAHYKVVSNGLLLEESNIDARTRLTHWKQSVPVSCWLYVLGVSEFAIQYVGEVDGRSIQTWVHPQNREAGFYDFAEPTKDVIRFYSDYVGPYAYEKVANIQSPSIGGGMETSSAIFYGEDLVNGKRDVRLRNVVIHELAHQWFGNAVTESTWDDAWLSEGFATFFTLLFIENAYGHDEFESGLLKARKTIYDIASRASTFSIIADRTAEIQPVTSGITYQKGAWFLYMLRDMIGHDAFRKGIRSYYAAHFNGSATTRDFMEEMEKASGKDLTSTFEQWLYHPENPVLKGKWTYDKRRKQVDISIEQAQRGNMIFDLPVELGVYSTDSQAPEIRKFRINGKKTMFSIPMEGSPEKLVIDPRNVLLAQMEFGRG